MVRSDDVNTMPDGPPIPLDDGAREYLTDRRPIDGQLRIDVRAPIESYQSARTRDSIS